MAAAKLTHARLASINHAGGELLIGGVPLRLVAERVGRTPFYAYDRAGISARVAQLRAALMQLTCDAAYLTRQRTSPPSFCLRHSRSERMPREVETTVMP